MMHDIPEHRDEARPATRDRRVVRAGELTADEISLIAAAEVPAEHAHLDAEISDGKP